MKKSIFAVAIAFTISLGFATAQEAAKSMSSRKNITQNIGLENTLSALNDGMKATSMAKKLETKGHFTFFAITNDGFDKTLHGGTSKMMSEEYLPMLTKILNFHTVEGELSTQDLKNKIALGNGVALLKTLEGESLKVTLENGKLVISDTIGNKATVLESDLKQSNGVVHIIDTMLLPQGL